MQSKQDWPNSCIGIQEAVMHKGLPSDAPNEKTGCEKTDGQASKGLIKSHHIILV